MLHVTKVNLSSIEESVVLTRLRSIACFVFVYDLVFRSKTVSHLPKFVSWLQIYSQDTTAYIVACLLTVTYKMHDMYYLYI